MRDSERKKVLDRLLLGLPDVKEGTMFGYPAYYVNGKLFACIVGDGVGVKVPEDMATRMLAESGVVPFRPFGKPKMREWIQLDRARAADYGKDARIFHAAIDFVRQTAADRGRKK